MPGTRRLDDPQARCTAGGERALGGRTANEDWLQDTACSAGLPEDERAQRLVRWSQAPGARFCHPREEHLLPLHVCYGVAQAPCTKRFGLTILNRKSSMYLW